MTTYTIKNGNGETIYETEAKTATEALEIYCENHPNEDTGFSRGGLTCDAETYGKVSASIKTDGGRIYAEAA